MANIIQGSNDPLVLEVEGLDTITNLSACLYSYGERKKEWSLEDAMIQGKQLVLPLSETDTLKLSRGIVTLDIKVLNKAGTVVFMDLVRYKVVERPNKNAFVPAGHE